jgi:hypothetical protein
MTKLKVLSAGLLATTMLATPVMAQWVTQEPGARGFYYPNSRYLRGGYGVIATPGPGYYYGNPYPFVPRVGAFATAPWNNGYAYYYSGAPVTVRPGPPVGAFATAPWDSGYAYYYGEPVTVWVAP